MGGFALARLVTLGERSARLRLGGIAAGVMLGVALFLLLFGASQAFGERSLRSTWVLLEDAELPDLQPGTALEPGRAAAASALDHYRGEQIRLLLVACGPECRVPVPGLERPPAPGEYAASPALAELVAAAPPGQLGERYGRLRATIAPGALEGPEALVAVVGVEPEALLHVQSHPGPKIVDEFRGYDYASGAYRTVAVIGAIAVLLPVLLLVSIVTELGAVQRAERFSALRLLGATPGRIARIAAAETAATTLLGGVLGLGLYLAAVPAAARLRVGSSGFFPADLLVSPSAAALVVLGTAAATGAVAWWRTLRAGIGPLGASRERRERPVGAASLLPLLAGLAVLGASVGAVRAEARQLPVEWMLVGGFLLVMLGLLWAGPLLTSWGGRLAAALARTPAQLIGASRTVRHPRAGFRSVAGLVAAVYATTVFAVASTAATGVEEQREGAGLLDAQALYAPLGAPPRDGSAAQELDGRLAAAAAASGARVVEIAGMGEQGRLVLGEAAAVSLGAPAAASPSGLVSIDIAWLRGAPADPRPAQAAPGAGPGLLIALGDGTPEGAERLRTALMTGGLRLGVPPLSRGDAAAVAASAAENQFAALASLGVLIAGGLSAVSLAVSAIAALADRRRVLGLLGLLGMPSATLRRIVLVETAIPVATVLLLAIGGGAFTAWAVVGGLSKRSLGWPDPVYALALAACLAVLGAVALATAAVGARMLHRGAVRFE